MNNLRRAAVLKLRPEGREKYGHDSVHHYGGRSKYHTAVETPLIGDHTACTMYPPKLSATRADLRKTGAVILMRSTAYSTYDAKMMRQRFPQVHNNVTNALSIDMQTGVVGDPTRPNPRGYSQVVV